MLSTLAMIGVLGSLAKAGPATRHEVGRRDLNFLWLLGAFLFQLPAMDHWVQVSGTFLLGPIVAGVGLFCGASCFGLLLGAC